MSKNKGKRDSPTVGGCKDLEYQNLEQDFHKLHKEANVTRSRLDAGKQRKMVLAAEVRFLRRRVEYFAKAKTLNSLPMEKSIHPPNLSTRAKHVTRLGRKEAGRNKLPAIPESKPKRKRYIGKETDFYSSAPTIGHHHSKLLRGGKEAAQQSLIPFAGFEHNGRTEMSKQKTVSQNVTPVFDLNQDSTHSGNEVSFPIRAPTFDLNEISTGDEDFQNNFEALRYEEVKKSLMRGPKDEMQNDLMLSLCRNDAGEGPSRVGKRKTSWQDPVALRV